MVISNCTILLAMENPQYAVEPQMEALLKMTNYLVGNIVQQLKEAY
ncbi:MAG: hypothetical protein IIC15_06460 [Thaumarchaeota archaeon]|nr:hypothetical protein [Nitrososphaerota archaeon]